MKLKSLILAAFVATSSAAFAAENAPITFNGVLTLSNAQHFGLVNEGATRTAWVKLGDEFDGYTLADYDAASRTLTLERGGKTYSVVLADGKFTGTAEVARGTKASLADAEAMFASMNIKEMLGKTLEKSLEAQTKMMGTQMEKQFGGKIPPEELAAFQQKMLEALIAAVNPEQMEKDMVQIYADAFTKEELSAMAAFNSTPAGKVMIEKQPEIQGRVQELMMPRMAAAMPEIGKIGQEFGQQQQARIKAEAEKANGAATPETPAGPTPTPAPGAGQ